VHARSLSKVPLHPIEVAAVPIIGSDVAFFVVFGAFVVAFVVLSVITLRWAIRRDRAGRAAWQERVRGTGRLDGEGPRTNGRPPKDPSRWGGGGPR